MSKINDLTGKKFGRLIVLERGLNDSSKRKRVRWQCRCECGKQVLVLSTNLIQGYIRSCGCLNKDSHYKGHNDISGTYWELLKFGAIKRGYEFDLSIEFLWNLFQQQKGKCALTGLPIKLERHYRKNKQTASLDRIDNKKGYLSDNVCWVHKDINFMKGKLDLETFIKYAERIAKNGKQIRQGITTKVDVK